MDTTPIFTGILLGMGFFASKDEGDIEAIAERLDAPPKASGIERELNRLEEAVDFLVAEANLSDVADRSPPPDANGVVKARALSKEVQRGTLSIGPAGSESSAGGVSTAAAKLRNEKRHHPDLVKRFLDQLSNEHASHESVDDLLHEIVDRLESYQEIESYLLREQLVEREERPTADHIRELHDRSASSKRARSETREDFEEISRAAERIIEAVLDERGLATNDIAPKLRIAERELESNAGSEESAGKRAAQRVARKTSLQSSIATELIESLENGTVHETEIVLEDVVDRLDRSATVDAISHDVQYDTVRSATERVAAEIEDIPGRTGEVLTDRIEDLLKTLDRVDETNIPVLYAVQREIEFYRSHLLTSLVDDIETGRDTGTEGITVKEITQRRERIQREFIDQRTDHNHSIPLYFMALVDELLDEGQTSHGEVAGGYLASADAVLDYITGLYERNEYSVMLRQLRG